MFFKKIKKDKKRINFFFCLFLMTELTYYKTITLYTRIIKGQEEDKKKFLFVSNDRINVLQNHYRT